ncbi:MAG: hypothetical protein IPI67_07230 [Myxococcales bacterium]|nr:hypothetical protein [Myxococcales bacterium]
MLGGRTLAFVLGLLALECQGGPNANERADAERVVVAVRALREADNEDKLARLAALRAIESTGVDSSELKRTCVSAYELYTKGLDAVRAVKKSLSSDAGSKAAERAGELLLEAERDVAAGKQQATRCSEIEGRVVAKFKLN